jgi:copper chaperone CopZ
MDLRISEYGGGGTTVLSVSGMTHNGCANAVMRVLLRVLGAPPRAS